MTVSLTLGAELRNINSAILSLGEVNGNGLISIAQSNKGRIDGFSITKSIDMI